MLLLLILAPSSSLSAESLTTQSDSSESPVSIGANDRHRGNSLPPRRKRFFEEPAYDIILTEDRDISGLFRNPEGLHLYQISDSGQEVQGQPGDGPPSSSESFGEATSAFGHFSEPAYLPLTAREVFAEQEPESHPNHRWWILPREPLIYKSYLAADKEPRMQFLSLYDTKSKRRVQDAVLGGRVAILHFGDPSNIQADAFQLVLEGAVFARVLPDEASSMLEGSDYRVGLFGTWRYNRIAYKAGYYHISSHVGDEYLLANPAFNRVNYVRDSLLAGISCQATDATRLYGEVACAPGVEGGAKPMEFQFGSEYTPVAQSPVIGAPFAAVNAHLRQDFDFQTGVNIVSGWSWQGAETKRRLRLGFNYYNGPSLQYEFLDRWENLVGGGIWLDY